MKKNFFFLFLSFPVFACSQVTVSEVISKDSLSYVSSDKFQQVITRQNSCSIFLTDFSLNLDKQGAFLADIQVDLTSPMVATKSYRLLLNDVIETKESKKNFTYTIKNLKILDQAVLTDVTEIDVSIKLITIDKGKVDMSLLTPILNLIVPTSSPLCGLFANIINQAKSADSGPALIFKTSIQVAENILEFNKLSEKKDLIVLKNDYSLGILFEGNKSIKFDSNVIGIGGNLFNGISQFVCGKTVIPQSEVAYDGLAKIFITKDKNGVLPSSLSNALDELDVQMSSANFERDYSSVKLKVEDISTSAANAANEKTISKTSLFSINMYVKLANLFAQLQQGLEKDQKIPPGWLNSYRAFYNYAFYNGSANSVTGIGITDIYNGKVGLVFLPYSLSDDQLLSMYSWQIAIHTVLKENSIVEFAKPVPKK